MMLRNAARRRELTVRAALGAGRALGASRKSVVWECMRETVIVVMAGLAIGAIVLQSL